MKYIKKVAETPLNEEANVIDSLASGSDTLRNAPSIRAVNEAIAEVWQAIYPVGSIYISANSVNPSVIFGGTWEQLKQKFLIAADDTSSYTGGSTGGAFSRNYTPSGNIGGHALTVNEMPTHNHGGNYISGFAETTIISAAEGSGIVVDNVVTDPLVSETENRGGNAAHNHSFTGTQATIDTTPPYLAVYMWKRIA